MCIVHLIISNKKSDGSINVEHRKETGYVNVGLGAIFIHLEFKDMEWIRSL